jgi:hypothetical protein
MSQQKTILWYQSVTDLERKIIFIKNQECFRERLF